MKTLDINAPNFTSNYRREINEYARLRVNGKMLFPSMIQAFGLDRTDYRVREYGEFIEGTAAYLEAFERILRETPLHELWNEEKAAQLLLGIANGENKRAAVEAVKELNLIAGLTDSKRTPK